MRWTERFAAELRQQAEEIPSTSSTECSLAKSRPITKGAFVIGKRSEAGGIPYLGVRSQPAIERFRPFRGVGPTISAMTAHCGPRKPPKADPCSPTVSG